MKKFLSLLLGVAIAGTAFAQFNFRTSTDIGQTLSAANVQDQDTFEVHFNTAKSNSTWVSNTETSTYTVSIQKCQTQKGIQAIGFINSTTTTANEAGSFKCSSHGSNGNPARVHSIDSLQNIMRKSVLAGNKSDTLTRAAACLFDLADNNQAFGMYPGKAKRIEYVFRFKMGGKTLTSDISLDMLTYHAGTTGKTAAYSMSVYKSSTFSEANLYAPTVDIYTTGEATKRINVAQAIGLTPADFTNKDVYIVFKTLGTSNASNVVDGEAHAVDINNEPVAIDPTVAFDNIHVTFINPQWVVPAGAVANSIVNHNNGNPVVTETTDYTGGTPVTIVAGTEAPVTFKLQSSDRVGALTITEGNDGGSHAAGFTFAATGAIKQKDGNGDYTIDVPYTLAINETSGVYTLTIAAPASGSASDDLEVTVLANVPLELTRTIRLEINNGIRFWYNIAAFAVITSSVETAKGNAFVSVNNKTVSLQGIQSGSRVSVYTMAGQLVQQQISASDRVDFTLGQGVYILKAEANGQQFTTKAIVR